MKPAPDLGPEGVPVEHDEAGEEDDGGARADDGRQRNLDRAAQQEDQRHEGEQEVERARSLKVGIRAESQPAVASVDRKNVARLFKAEGDEHYLVEYYDHQVEDIYQRSEYYAAVVKAMQPQHHHEHRHHPQHGVAEVIAHAVEVEGLRLLYAVLP